MQKHLAAMLSATLSLLAARADARSDQYTPSGDSVRWHRRSVPFVIDPSAYDAQSMPEPAAVMARAWSAWSPVRDTPAFEVQAGRLGPIGYDPVRRENNVSGVTVFRAAFPNPLTHPVLAVTILSRDESTGEILDADILVDAQHNRFAGLDARGMMGVAGAPNDWQNVLTHEAGHALGLSEDPMAPTATMFPTSPPGEVAKRDLDSEDLASAGRAYSTTIEFNDGTYPSPGCGARVVPWRAHQPRNGLGFALAGLAFLGLAAWRARGRRMSILAGGFLLVAGAPGAVMQQPHTARVTRVDTRMEGGLVITRAEVVVDGARRVVERPGGRHHGIVQQVFDTPGAEVLEEGMTVDASSLGL